MNFILKMDGDELTSDEKWSIGQLKKLRTQ